MFWKLRLPLTISKRNLGSKKGAVQLAIHSLSTEPSRAHVQQKKLQLIIPQPGARNGVEYTWEVEQPEDLTGSCCHNFSARHYVLLNVLCENCQLIYPLGIHSCLHYKSAYRTHLEMSSY